MSEMLDLSSESCRWNSDVFTKISEMQISKSWEVTLTSLYNWGKTGTFREWFISA